jgi:hypothetical protein
LLLLVAAALEGQEFLLAVVHLAELAARAVGLGILTTIRLFLPTVILSSLGVVDQLRPLVAAMARIVSLPEVTRTLFHPSR